MDSIDEKSTKAGDERGQRPRVADLKSGSRWRRLVKGGFVMGECRDSRRGQKARGKCECSFQDWSFALQMAAVCGTITTLDAAQAKRFPQVDTFSGR